MGDVAALISSHMSGAIPFNTTNRNSVPNPKTITAATMAEQKQVLHFCNPLAPVLTITSHENDQWPLF